MKTAIIEQVGNLPVENKITQDELFNRVELLEKESARYKLNSQEELRRCENKYLAMLDSVDDYMTLVDRNLQVLWANQRAKNIFGSDLKLIEYFFPC